MKTKSLFILINTCMLQRLHHEHTKAEKFLLEVNRRKKRQFQDSIGTSRRLLSEKSRYHKVKTENHKKPAGKSRGHGCLYRCPGKIHPISNGEVFYCHLTAFQQPGQLCLKLQGTNGIRVLFTSNTGLDNFVEQGKTCAKEVGTLH